MGSRCEALSFGYSLTFVHMVYEGVSGWSTQELRNDLLQTTNRSAMTCKCHDDRGNGQGH